MHVHFMYVDDISILNLYDCLGSLIHSVTDCVKVFGISPPGSTWHVMHFVGAGGRGYRRVNQVGTGARGRATNESSQCRQSGLLNHT